MERLNPDNTWTKEYKREVAVRRRWELRRRPWTTSEDVEMGYGANYINGVKRETWTNKKKRSSQL